MIGSADNGVSRSFLAIQSTVQGCFLFILILSSQQVAAQASPPSGLEIELVRPDRLLNSLLSLFEKTSVRHPAEALAAWKNSGGNETSLGKPAEALISLLNPEMVKEFQSLERGRFTLSTGKGGKGAWRLALPHDDGTFATLAPALAISLTHPIDAPLQGLPVFRLGTPSAPLSVSEGSRSAFGSDREQLELAFRALQNIPLPMTEEPGIRFKVAPRGLADSNSLNIRRLIAGLESSATTGIEGRFRIDADSFAFDWTANRVEIREAISKEWLEGLPAEKTSFAFAAVIDTDPKSLKQLFDIVDRIEKADPARADVAPSRIRLNLIANAFDIKAEAALWPKLQGISGSIGEGDDGRFGSVLVGLHFKDAPSANVIADILAKRPDEVEFRKAGATLWIGYGKGALDAHEKALDGKTASVAQLFKGTLPKRLGAIWPGRLPESLISAGPVAKGLKDSPPVVFRSDSDGTFVRNAMTWGDLRSTLKRCLDALPLVLPRDRSSSP